jgi:hypothetical protein
MFVLNDHEKKFQFSFLYNDYPTDNICGKTRIGSVQLLLLGAAQAPRALLHRGDDLVIQCEKCSSLSRTTYNITDRYNGISQLLI